MSEPSGADISSSGEGARVLTAGDIATLLKGNLVGDATVEVRAVAPLDRAGPNDISFLGVKRYAPQLATTRAGVVLVDPGLATVPGNVACRIVVARPRDALLTVLPLVHREPRRAPGVHPTAQLGRGVRLGRDVTIGPNVVIEGGALLGDRVWIDANCVVGRNVKIGDDSRLFPGVVCYPGTEVGARVALHAGVRLGSDGFGYVQRDGRHVKVPHAGRCIVGDDVEIGANTTIDRGSIDDTVIGAGTKIDNLVHIAHNVRIGRGCLILAQVGVSGSAHIGDFVTLAGQVGLAGHNNIGDRAIIGAQAGVLGDIPAGEVWSGYPARPHRLSLRTHAVLLKLTQAFHVLERMIAERQAAESRT